MGRISTLFVSLDDGRYLHPPKPENGATYARLADRAYRNVPGGLLRLCGVDRAHWGGVDRTH